MRSIGFAEAVASSTTPSKIDLLFNNAGVGGGASIVDRDRDVVGPDVQHLLVRGVLQHPRVHADADGQRRLASGQHAAA